MYGVRLVIKRPPAERGRQSSNASADRLRVSPPTPKSEPSAGHELNKTVNRLGLGVPRRPKERAWRLSPKAMNEGIRHSLETAEQCETCSEAH